MRFNTLARAYGEAAADPVFMADMAALSDGFNEAMEEPSVPHLGTSLPDSGTSEKSIQIPDVDSPAPYNGGSRHSGPDRDITDAGMVVTDHLPDDTDCLNCGHFVGEVHGCHTLCPNCHAPLGACSE